MEEKQGACMQKRVVNNRLSWKYLEESRKSPENQ